MKKVIYVPDNQSVIFSKDIDYDHQTVLVFDELPFENEKIGTLEKFKNKWYIKEDLTKKPHKFSTNDTIYFNTLDEMFIMLSMEGYVAYVE